MNNIHTERRITNRLCLYWDALRKKINRNFPAEDMLSPDEIIGIWPYCFLINVELGKKTGEPLYELQYMGEMIESAYESTLNIENTYPIMSPDLQSIKIYLDEIIENSEPLIDEGEFLDINDQTVKFRQCFLPLGPKDSKITKILGAMHYKIYND